MNQSLHHWSSTCYSRWICPLTPLCWRPSSSSSAADYLLQEMICIIEQWTSDNYLSFNTSKCKYMIISCKRNPPLPDIPLQLCESALERVDSYKYLGVLLSCDLSWSLHAEFACQKARWVLGLLYRRFYGQASQDSLKQLYLSLVQPHLEYAIARCGILTSPKIEMPWILQI